MYNLNNLWISIWYKKIIKNTIKFMTMHIVHLNEMRNVSEDNSLRPFFLIYIFNKKKIQKYEMKINTNK